MSAGKKSGKDIVAAIQRVLDGDVDSYELIYRASDPSLRSFIGYRYGYLGSDCVDEVAIRTHEYVYSHLDKYDSDRGASFQTWMNWQTPNIARQVRAEWFSRRSVSFDEEKHETWAGTLAGPDELVEAERRTRVIRQEYESLAGEERLSIGLHDVEGLTFADSADVAGTSVGRVRWQRRRGLALLKRRLRNRGIRPCDVDTTPVPVWHGRDNTPEDDDFTSSVTATLPVDPDPLNDAAEEEVPAEC